MKNKSLILPFIFCFFGSLLGFSQAPSLSDKAKVSLITCGSGEELYSVFGHTAIRIQDSEKQIDEVYNYGTFDFNTSFFYLKFMYGNLEYYLSSSSYQDFIYHYQISNRSVFEQELKISKNDKQKIFNKLHREINSADKNYTYKFIENNCTTKVADLLKGSISNNNIKDSYSNTDELSYRGIINSYLDSKYFEKLGINILFGRKTDQLCDQIFLPTDLMRSIAVAKANGADLSAGTENVFSQSNEEQGFVWWNNVFIILGLFALIILLKNQKVDLIFINIIGYLGVFMLLFSLISQHDEVSLNTNILLFNPLLLALAIAFKRNQENNYKTITWLLLACSIIFIFITMSSSGFYTIVPFVLPIGLIVYRLPYYKVKKEKDEAISNPLG